MVSKLLQISALCLLLQGLNACQLRFTEANNAPTAVNGVLDLRKWDIKKDGPVKLNGYWEFYWRNLYTSDPGKDVKPDALINVPGSWNGMLLNSKEKLGHEGYATLRLKILLPPHPENPQLMIQMRESATAWRLTHKNKILFESGRTGRDKAGTKFLYVKPTQANIEYGEELILYLNISNFSHYRAGPTRPLVLGEALQVQRVIRNNRQTDYFLMGVIFVIGVYNLFLFFLRSSERAPLVLGLYSLTNVVWTLFANGHFQERFPDFFYLGDYLLSFFYTLYYGQVGLLAIFGYYIFPRYVTRKFAVIAAGFTSASILSVYILPAHIFTFLIYFSHLFTVFVMVWLMVAMLRTGLNTRNDLRPWISLAGFFVFTAGIANDIFIDIGLYFTLSFIHYGFFVFILSQAVIIAVSNARARKTAEFLSNELLTKNDELSRLDKIKDEFLANTSHELRTPLSGIIGIAESMMDGATGLLTEVQLQNMAMITTSGKRLSHLLNDILDYSRLKFNNIELHTSTVHIKDITDMVLAILSPLARNKNISLKNSIENEMTVQADENRLQQILYNLLGNAIKFTESGTVEISARIESDYLEITVSDTGIGIPEQSQKRIFESFEQADGSVGREFGGAGLGLSVTRRLVELHGGWIKVNSTPGQGSHFIFTLPTAPLTPGVEKKPVPEITSPLSHNLELYRNLTVGLATGTEENDSTGQPSKILVVDDEPVNLQVIANHLSDLKMELTLTSDSREALSYLEKGRHFDLALLDVMMPRVTGYELTEAIRKKYAPIELPVILLTARNQVRDLVHGFELGANDYISKPFSKQELLSRIQAQIKITNDHKELKALNQELQHLATVKDEFMSNISHELMTPLAAIYGYSELIQSSDTDIGRDLLSYIGEINRQSETLRSSINDLLMVTELATRVKLKKSRIKLLPLARGVIDVLTSFYQEREVSLTNEIPPDFEVLADEHFLGRTLECILRNAANYNTHGGQAFIKAFHKKGYAHIEIRDTGYGIPPEEQELVWEKFYRYAQPEFHLISGMGLGLYLSREIVLIYGGYITMESEVGQGTTISIRIPNKEKDAEAMEAARVEFRKTEERRSGQTRRK